MICKYPTLPEVLSVLLPPPTDARSSMQWNPGLAADCQNPFAGWWVCVGVKPATRFSVSLPTSSPLTLPETTIWTSSSLRRFTYTNPSPTPSNDRPPTVTSKPNELVQPATTKDCLSWYQIDDREVCQDVVDLFGSFSLKDFIAWNPDVGERCDRIQVSPRSPFLVSIFPLFLTVSRIITGTAWPCPGPPPAARRLPLPPKPGQPPLFASREWLQTATNGGESAAEMTARRSA